MPITDELHFRDITRSIRTILLSFCCECAYILVYFLTFNINRVTHDPYLGTFHNSLNRSAIQSIYRKQRSKKLFFI